MFLCETHTYVRLNSGKQVNTAGFTENTFSRSTLRDSITESFLRNVLLFPQVFLLLLSLLLVLPGFSLSSSLFFL